MSDEPRRPVERRTAVSVITVAMVTVAIAFLVVVVEGAQVEVPLALTAALLVLAAARHLIARR